MSVSRVEVLKVDDHRSVGLENVKGNVFILSNSVKQSIRERR